MKQFINSSTINTIEAATGDVLVLIWSRVSEESTNEDIGSICLSKKYPLVSKAKHSLMIGPQWWREEFNLVIGRLTLWYRVKVWQDSIRPSSAYLAMYAYHRFKISKVTILPKRLLLVCLISQNHCEEALFRTMVVNSHYIK